MIPAVFPSISPWTALVLVAAIGGTVALGWHDPDVGRTLAHVVGEVALAAAPSLLKRAGTKPPEAP